MRRPKVVVVGLDLSLRAAAACAIPLTWGQDIRRVRTAVFGYPLDANATQREHAERRAQIAHDVVVFCINNGARHVFVEDYAFSKRASSVTKLAELGGVVKDHVLDCLDLEVVPVTASVSRKTMLQRLVKRDVKAWVLGSVRQRFGAQVAAWGEDEIDAFVVANHGAMVAGGVAMTFDGVA